MSGGTHVRKRVTSQAPTLEEALLLTTYCHVPEEGSEEEPEEAYETMLFRPPIAVPQEPAFVTSTDYRRVLCTACALALCLVGGWWYATRQSVPLATRSPAGDLLVISFRVQSADGWDRGPHRPDLLIPLEFLAAAAPEPEYVPEPLEILDV
jgi:hypothetical protein